MNHGYRVVAAEILLFISKQQRVSDEDKDGSQDEGHKHLDVDVVPGTVQLPEEHARFRMGHLWCVCVPCVFSHLKRPKMAMATVRAMRDSAYPTVYIVFTKVKYQ